jgi:hypothetical protein
MSRYAGFRRRWKKLIEEKKSKENSDPLRYILKCREEGKEVTNPHAIYIMNKLQETATCVYPW